MSTETLEAGTVAPAETQATPANTSEATPLLEAHAEAEAPAAEVTQPEQAAPTKTQPEVGGDDGAFKPVTSEGTPIEITKPLGDKPFPAAEKAREIIGKQDPRTQFLSTLDPGYAQSLADPH